MTQNLLDHVALWRVDEGHVLADAVVGGDLALLARLLAEHPGLTRDRSPYGHGSTLLHYVSANGVEIRRQRTPANIVRIARRLLDAGSDVDALSGAYGGGPSPLDLDPGESPGS